MPAKLSVPDAESLPEGIRTTMDKLVGQIRTNLTALDQALTTSSVVTPTRLTANQHDYAPPNGAGTDRWRVSADAARDVTGLGAAGFADGDRVLIMNVGPFTITLVHESGSSIATNRFVLVGAVNLAIPQYGCVAVVRDTTLDRWLVEGL